MTNNSDEQTTIADLRALVARFVDERHWQIFHSPKNLAMSVAIEAAELMEHFQWISLDDSRRLTDDRERRVAVGEEIADVCCYLLALVNQLELDLGTLVRDKMVKNAIKYPAPAVPPADPMADSLDTGDTNER